ncbi:MAG: acyl-CoA dehydrogenase family protein [Candidatus Binataceae bacterium]
MDFSFNAEDEAFRQELRSWLEQNLSDEMRRPQLGFMFEESEEDWQRRLEWHRKMHAAGWVGIGWPKEYSGRAATLTQQLIYDHELARANAPMPVNAVALGLAGPTLMVWGTEEQKRRYLPRMLFADEIWCQGFSEPGSGSDLASLQTRALEEGDYFIVNGQKVWTSDAHHADMCILLLRTDPQAPKHKGLSFLMVDMHSAGIKVRPLVQITGDRNFNEVFFEDVKVPKKNLLGEKNQGWQVAITTLMFERSLLGSEHVAIDPAELLTLAKTVDRNGRRAWDDPDVRDKIARLICDSEALKYTRLRDLTRRLRGLPPGPEGSIVKLGLSDLNLRISSFAMELLGPYSQLEYRARWARDQGKWSYRMLAARALTIGGGTTEIQHNIIGERVLGLPKG